MKNNPASAEEQSLKFSIKVVNKTTASAAQFAKYIFLHTYSLKLKLPAERAQTKASYSLFN